MKPFDIEVAPDWVCEVLSRPVDRPDKAAISASKCVGYTWFADPDARTLKTIAIVPDIALSGICLALF